MLVPSDAPLLVAVHDHVVIGTVGFSGFASGSYPGVDELALNENPWFAMYESPVDGVMTAPGGCAAGGELPMYWKVLKLFTGCD